MDMNELFLTDLYGTGLILCSYWLKENKKLKRMDESGWNAKTSRKTEKLKEAKEDIKNKTKNSKMYQLY